MQRLLRDRRVIAHAVDVLMVLTPSSTAADAAKRLTDRANRLRVPVSQAAAELITEHTPGLPQEGTCLRR